jgi:hypothetical protein
VEGYNTAVEVGFADGMLDRLPAEIGSGISRSNDSRKSQWPIFGSGMTFEFALRIYIQSRHEVGREEIDVVATRDLYTQECLGIAGAGKCRIEPN